MIKHVFLDLDDTVFDFRAAEATAIRSTLEQMGVPVDDAVISLYSRINDSYWKMLERGEITRELMLTERFRKLYGELGYNASAEQTQSTYLRRLGESCMLIDGTEELLRTLSAEYPLYAVTNGNVAVQDSRIVRAGIGGYFKGVFISERVGANKPSVAFFERCFSSIEDFDPKEGIIVGDSLTSDILGGRRVGLITCLFNPRKTKITGDVLPDYEISSLYELPDLLHRI